MQNLLVDLLAEGFVSLEISYFSSGFIIFVESR